MNILTTFHTRQHDHKHAHLYLCNSKRTPAPTLYLEYLFIRQIMKSVDYKRLLANNAPHFCF